MIESLLWSGTLVILLSLVTSCTVLIALGVLRLNLLYCSAHGCLRFLCESCRCTAGALIEKHGSRNTETDAEQHEGQGNVVQQEVDEERTGDEDLVHNDDLKDNDSRDSSTSSHPHGMGRGGVLVDHFIQLSDELKHTHTHGEIRREYHKMKP